MVGKILNQFGEDLGVAVSEKSLPSTELDVNSPKVKGFRLLDFVIINLTRPMNSMFFVHDDLAYVQAYVNSLALVMSQTERFSELIHLSTERNHQVKPLYPSLNYFLEQTLRRLADKRLHTLNMSLLLSTVGQDTDAWDEVFRALKKEAQEENYFLVINGLNQLFGKDKINTLHYQALAVFFSTRGKVSVTFIAPLTWWDYANNIERGMFPLLIQHRTPVLFSPRPSEIPTLESQLARFAPDSNFDFR